MSCSLSDYSFLFSPLPPSSERSHSWGPPLLSTTSMDIPYAPFSKNDRLCHIADWQALDSAKFGSKSGASNSGQRGGGANMYGSTFGAGQSNYFSYYHVDDEATFSIVDSRTITSKKSQGNGRMNQQKIGGSHYAQRSSYFRDGRNQNSGLGSGSTLANNTSGGGPPYPRRRHWRDMNGKPQRLRESSMAIGADWKIIEEIEFSRLSKLQYEPDVPEGLADYGTLYYYDRSYDRVTTKNEKNLNASDKMNDFQAITTTTSDDPILNEMAEQGLGHVFATDSILSLLMAAPRSVFPWDLILRKEENGRLWFDKRDGQHFDFLTVNETAAEPPLETDKDTLNSASALATEATCVNRQFAEQVLKQNEKIEFSPLKSGAEERLGPAYRYRRWDLGPGAQLIARVEVDACTRDQSTGSQYLTIRAMNETDPKLNNTDWRQKLDSQRGSILATEVRNNGNKLARWVYQSLLAGSDFLKLGFVSRVNPRDRLRHVILGTSQYRPEDFASQINLNWTNGYGILKAMIDLCLKLPAGLYVLTKDPNKPLLRLYACPGHVRFEELRKDGNGGSDEVAANETTMKD